MVQPNGQQQADKDVAPAWLKTMLKAQEQNQARLLRLEVELRKSDKRRKIEGTVKQKHKFNKAIYIEQYSLTLKYIKSWRKLQSQKITRRELVSLKKVWIC